MSPFLEKNLKEDLAAHLGHSAQPPQEDASAPLVTRFNYKMCVAPRKYFENTKMIMMTRCFFLLDVICIVLCMVLRNRYVLDLSKLKINVEYSTKEKISDLYSISSDLTIALAIPIALVFMYVLWGSPSPGYWKTRLFLQLCFCVVLLAFLGIGIKLASYSSIFAAVPLSLVVPTYYAIRQLGAMYAADDDKREKYLPYFTSDKY